MQIRAGEVRKTENKGKFSSVCIYVLPVWSELSSIGEALVKLLQYLLALTVREWEAEGEEGVRSSHF